MFVLKFSKQVKSNILFRIITNNYICLKLVKMSNVNVFPDGCVTIRDEHDFNLLLKEHWNDVYYACVKYSGSESDAQELAQDIFISIWKRKEEISLQHISAYLHKAAKLASLQFLRSKSRRKLEYRNETPVITDNYHPQNEAEFKELYANFLLSCQTLSEPGRQVFMLSREYDLSHKQIAKKMNLSLGMVQYHMGIALKVIRKRIKTYCE